MSYLAWSSAYSVDPIEPNRCYVPLNEWQRIHADQPGARRIFGRIVVGDKETFCPLGEPMNVEHLGGMNVTTLQPILIPDWVREILYVEGSGDPVEITWMSEDSFPNATRVVLRPHDSAFYHADAREELERALTGYGVIAMGTSIPIAIQMLGGFSVQMDIIKTEPANIVLLEGDEIAFEFEESLDAEVPVPVPPVEEPVPVPEPPVEEPVPPATGQSLGGTNRPLLPDGRPWNPWRV